MDEEPSESSRFLLDRDQAIAAAVLVVVVAAIALYGYKVWDASRLRGEVTAEQLSSEFVAAPCEARPLYDGKTWTIIGTVVSRNENAVKSPSFFALAGGTHLSDGKPCATLGPFFQEGDNTLILHLKWGESYESDALIGETLRVTCRIKLTGFGLNDHDGITGSDCRLE